jgi:hypothetical protein
MDFDQRTDVGVDRNERVILDVDRGIDVRAGFGRDTDGRTVLPVPSPNLPNPVTYDPDPAANGFSQAFENPIDTPGEFLYGGGFGASADEFGGGGFDGGSFDDVDPTGGAFDQGSWAGGGGGFDGAEIDATGGAFGAFADVDEEEFDGDGPLFPFF